MASTLVRVGDAPGDGQAMKTVNQLLCGVHIAAAGEALALARALGLDAEVALKALMSGAASSFMLGDRGPRMLQVYDEDDGLHDVEVRSSLNIFVKDMGIVSSAAKGAVEGATKGASAAKGAVESAVKGASSASKGTLPTVVSRVKSGAEAANRFLSAPGEAVKGLFRTAGADAARTTAAGAVRSVARATVQEVSQKTANDVLRYGINVAVDMGTRGRTDKTPWNSFTIPKFYNLVTTGDTKPQTASAPARETSSAGGGGW